MPWELVGWGGFACLVAAGAVLWIDGSVTAAALVVLLGALGIGAAALASLRGSPHPRRPPPP